MVLALSRGDEIVIDGKGYPVHFFEPIAMTSLSPSLKLRATVTATVEGAAPIINGARGPRTESGISFLCLPLQSIDKELKIRAGINDAVGIFRQTMATDSDGVYQIIVQESIPNA